MSQLCITGTLNIKFNILLSNTISELFMPGFIKHVPVMHNWDNFVEWEYLLYGYEKHFISHLQETFEIEAPSF